MHPDSIWMIWFRKLKCLLGFHDYCKWPDGNEACWNCGKERK